MKFKKYGDLIFGIIILAFDAFYFNLTNQVTIKTTTASINARSMPYLLCVLFTLLGVLQLISGFKTIRTFDPEKVTLKRTDGRTVLLTLICIVAYIMILEPVGFILSTIAFLFLMFVILTPQSEKRNLPLYLIIAAATSLFIYVSFRYGLSLMLPQGLIEVI